MILYVMVAGISALGVYIGLETVDRYEVIVRAVLGITVLYSFYRYYMHPKKMSDAPVETRIGISDYPKYLMIVFVVSTIGLWASIQVLPLIGYLMNWVG